MSRGKIVHWVSVNRVLWKSAVVKSTLCEYTARVPADNEETGNVRVVSKVLFGQPEFGRRGMNQRQC